MVLLGLAIEVDGRVFQLLAAGFCAQGEQVVLAQRQANAAIKHGIAEGVGAAGVAAVAAVRLALQLRTIQPHLTVAPAPITLVRQRVTAAVDVVVGLVQRAGAGAAVAVLLFVAGIDGQVDALVVQRGPAQAEVAGAGVLLIQLAESRVGSIAQGVALAEFTPQVEPQFAVDERAAQVETGLALVAVKAAVGEGGVAADRALPLIGGGAGDHVDDTAKGFGAVQRGHRPADDLDPLDGFGRHPAQFKVGMGDTRGRGVDALAVNEHQGVLGVHAANGHAAAAQAQV